MEYITKTCYLGDLEVDVEFGVTLEKDWLEPFSWGQSRGFEMVIADVDVLRVTVYDDEGTIILTEAQANARFGADAINVLCEEVSIDDLHA